MAKEVMQDLEDFRCHCGKIVCQLKDDKVIIKCRHCKRFIIINTKGLVIESDGDLKVEFE